MKEYPNDYVGKCFVFLDIDDFYEHYYADANVSIADLRDDTSNPNILFAENDYYLYAIFAGTHQGYDGLTLDFNLISIEKVEDN